MWRKIFKRSFNLSSAQSSVSRKCLTSFSCMLRRLTSYDKKEITSRDWHKCRNNLAVTWYANWGKESRNWSRSTLTIRKNALVRSVPALMNINSFRSSFLTFIRDNSSQHQGLLLKPHLSIKNLRKGRMNSSTFLLWKSSVNKDRSRFW